MKNDSRLNHGSNRSTRLHIIAKCPIWRLQSFVLVVFVHVYVLRDKVMKSYNESLSSHLPSHYPMMQLIREIIVKVSPLKGLEGIKDCGYAVHINQGGCSMHRVSMEEGKDT